MDLVVEDDSRVEAIYFLMSEENLRRKIGLPWVSFGSDEAAPATEGVFLESHPHPRAYGTFARLLGRFPILVYVGAVVLIFTAVEMILEDPFIHDNFVATLPIKLVIVAIVSAVIIGLSRWTQRGRSDLPQSAH